MALHTTCTALLVVDMMKPERPRAQISPTSFQRTRMEDGRRRSSAFLPQRNATAHSAERNCEITVASAAPCTPMPSAKINTGSRMIFTTAPSSTVIMPMLPKPWALMKLFMPSPSITNTVPHK